MEIKTCSTGNIKLLRNHAWGQAKTKFACVQQWIRIWPHEWTKNQHMDGLGSLQEHKPGYQDALIIFYRVEINFPPCCLHCNDRENPLTNLNREIWNLKWPLVTVGKQLFFPCHFFFFALHFPHLKNWRMMLHSLVNSFEINKWNNWRGKKKRDKLMKWQ